MTDDLEDVQLEYEQERRKRKQLDAIAKSQRASLEILQSLVKSMCTVFHKIDYEENNIIVLKRKDRCSTSHEEEQKKVKFV